MGSVYVSSCRCCIFVSAVHTVAILSAVFCGICSLLMFVSDASGDHMGCWVCLRGEWCLQCVCLVVVECHRKQPRCL